MKHKLFSPPAKDAGCSLALPSALSWANGLRVVGEMKMKPVDVRLDILRVSIRNIVLGSNVARLKVSILDLLMAETETSEQVS